MINGKDVASIEAALLWYATASDTDILQVKGATARVALGLHGSPKAKQQLEEQQQEKLKYKGSRCKTDPELSNNLEPQEAPLQHG